MVNPIIIIIIIIGIINVHEYTAEVQFVGHISKFRIVSLFLIVGL
jgi:hypothetical protein